SESAFFLGRAIAVFAEHDDFCPSGQRYDRWFFRKLDFAEQVAQDLTMAKKLKLPKLPEDWVREYCMSLPHATEDIQWEHDLLFRIGGKIFAGIPIEFPSHHWLSFKCTPEVFAELTQREGIVPALMWPAITGCRFCVTKMES